jgi:hypothetical protein
LQEVRDWNNVNELVSEFPEFLPCVVSRFQEFGSLSIQQTAVASHWQAEASWAEAFKASRPQPPRGFSLAVFRRAGVVLLVYSVHLKSNLGGIEKAIAKREAAMRQLLAHVTEMEAIYSKDTKVAIAIAGDFNTDSTDSRFTGEHTFELLHQNGFAWGWKNVPSLSALLSRAKGVIQTPASTASLSVEPKLFLPKSFWMIVESVIIYQSN